ncbi:MAG: type VI secretion system membrane subunit TssM, partial [Myxococcota bacterium]
MLKWIFAVVILVVVWAATILFELPFWPAILITLLVILALVAVFVIRRFRARRAARELEKALAAQAAEQARSARPDLQAEIQEMQNEFQKAITALKGSKLQKGGKNALYALPWYVIIGPPGSGKSTALRNSGIQFPYQSQSGGSVRGVGGTRNCDWWLTNEAVLLDTAGRWSTEDEDREEWQSFLDLTKKFRSRKPLNGMLVAVSVGDLGGAHEDEVVALAKQIRDRVDEVMARLQMSLPVYLLFTKCDLVPGFVETFSDLDRNSRGQMWGFTAPLATSIGEPGGYFNQRFDELATVVETRALRRMGEERRIESREKIHEFPQQFGVLKKNLGDFVSALFAENVFQETPQFRGAYFTSGTQEGRPIDRLMSRMAEAFGLQGRVAAPEHTVDPKSYFLRDVFAKVVFQDKDIAVRSAAEVRRQRIRQAITAAAIFFLALLISTLPAYTWFKS